MDRGILMKPSLIVATMKDLKTETRRLQGLKDINKEPDKWGIYSVDRIHHIWHISSRENFGPRTYLEFKSPYGVVGDRLYIKESHYRFGKWMKKTGTLALTKTGKQAWLFVPSAYGCRFEPHKGEWIRPNSDHGEGWYKRSAMFMEKKHARTWLKIIGMSLERLQDITGEDAKAEGVEPEVYEETIAEGNIKETPAYMPSFITLWDSINPDYPFSMNPWVWVPKWKREK